MKQPEAPGSQSKKTAAAATATTARLTQAILDSMRDGMTVTDQKGAFTLRNAAAERIAGVSPQHASALEWSRTVGVCLADGVTLLPENQLPELRALRGETV